MKIAICLHKIFTNVKFYKEKLNETTNKQINETNNIKKEKKRYHPNPTRISKRFFTSSLSVSILKFY